MSSAAKDELIEATSGVRTPDSASEPSIGEHSTAKRQAAADSPSSEHTPSDSPQGQASKSAAEQTQPLKKRTAKPTGPLAASSKISATSFRGEDPPNPIAANPVSASRIKAVTLGMALMTVGLLIQLIRVQFGPYAPVFAARSEVGSSRLEHVIPARGLIYDRDGRLLAANATSYVLEVETRQLTGASREAIPEVLSKVLVLPLGDLHEQLNRDWTAQGQFRIRLTRTDQAGEPLPITVDKYVANVLNQFLADPYAPDLSGLDVVPNPKRVYPNGELAGHVLGFVNQENEGYFGVEGYYDEWLSGKPITIARPMIPPEARAQPDPPAGVNLVLTLDLDIQQMVEYELTAAIKGSGAESGEIIVMDPSNGEILALAAWPSLDPNNYEPWLVDDEGQEPVITPAVGAMYEPGSTFKVITMASALDAGVVEPDTEFIDTGEIEVGGNTIRNWDGDAWGPQTMLGCMEHSLNVCLAWVASEKLGASTLYSYLRAFGVGHVTGVDLSGEVTGQLRTPRHPDWTESDLGTNSFGQGVSLTPMQLLAAVGAVANNGVMVQPHIVRQVVGPNGAYSPKTTVLGRPVSPETAQQLTEMLTTSMAGEAAYASLAGYELAGKTGTAQIPGDFGYDPRWTIASFIGWGPVDDPQFLVLIRLDKPEISPWGSVVAAPVFQKVVRRLVVFLQIPPMVVAG
jgi:cell division protein FtsI/penicillin-binding protein 2